VVRANVVRANVVRATVVRASRPLSRRHSFAPLRTGSARALQSLFPTRYSSHFQLDR